MSITSQRVRCHALMQVKKNQFAANSGVTTDNLDI